MPPPVMAGHARGFEETVPWEDGSRGLVDRYVSTVKLVITDPRRIFENLRDDAIWPPLAFGWIATGLGAVLAGIWNVLWALFMPVSSEEERAITLTMYVVAMIVGPILAPVSLFLTAGIYHLCLMLFGAADRGFPVTFRVVCYAYGLTIFQIVPFCGAVVGGLWTLVLHIWGAAMAQRTSAWRTACAYFLPLIVIMGLLVFVALAILAMIGAAGVQG
jgi:hypothetical protein